MHAIGQYLTQEMADRSWSPSELARRSGLTKQSISNLVNDDRDQLGRMLERKTIAGLAEALDVPSEVIVMKAAEAMGIPVPPPAANDPAAVLDDPGATFEDVTALVTGDEVPTDVLLDYLKRCLELASVIAATLAHRGHDGSI